MWEELVGKALSANHGYLETLYRRDGQVYTFIYLFINMNFVQKYT